jgi:hypothetical protein
MDTAIVTALIALVVALVTRQQMLTTKAKLRHELFDRRYAIYERIAQFLGDVLVSGGVGHGDEIKLLRDTKLAYFAFVCDEAVRVLVDDIYRHAVKLQVLQKKEESLAGEALESNVDKQTEVKEWFSATLQSLDEKFVGYLRLDIV